MRKKLLEMIYFSRLIIQIRRNWFQIYNVFRVSIHSSFLKSLDTHYVCNRHVLTKDLLVKRMEIYKSAAFKNILPFLIWFIFQFGSRSDRMNISIHVSIFTLGMSNQNIWFLIKYLEGNTYSAFCCYWISILNNNKLQWMRHAVG